MKQHHGILRIYIAEITPLKDEALYAHALSAASEQRKEKTLKYPSGNDRIRSLAAELLLKKALTDSGLTPGEMHYAYGRYGKPYLPVFPDFHFSISHSGDYVMVSASDAETGCDIEQIREISPSIAKRFFHPEEYARLCIVPEPERRELFFRYWTLKESFLKITGHGLHLPMNSFRIDLSHPDIRIIQDVSDRDYHFLEPVLSEQYCCAVCTEYETAAELFQENLSKLL